MEKRKKITMNETIRAKMVLYEKDWISHLTEKERELVKTILEADKEELEFLKKKYPDLCFIIELKKIEFENRDLD